MRDPKDSPYEDVYQIHTGELVPDGVTCESGF